MAKSKRLPTEPFEADVVDLTHDGRGVARIEGKAVFIDGALPGEKVRFQYTGKRRQYDEGKVLEILQPSEDRVEPKCEHFGICGGCSLQHLSAEAQLKLKQSQMLGNLRRIGHVEPETVAEAIVGPAWGYRRRARLSVFHLFKKGRTLVGFREKRNSYVADIQSCKVMIPAVGERLTELSELIQSISIADRVAQIEVSQGYHPTQDVALVLIFRNLEPFSREDLEKLAAFGGQFGFDVYQQPGGLASITPVYLTGKELIYSVDDYDVSFHFKPNDFTQVNADINQSMVKRALGWLDPKAGDQILELFCGLGNFTLPIATSGAHVVGIEGDAQLIQRAQDNAQANGVSNCSFTQADLSKELSEQAWFKGSYNKLLLDPPRSGAKEVIEQLAAIKFDRIVYVSCNPATLARDAGTLVNEQGYRLVAAGVMDMFPHTAHVESIALFER